MNIKSYMIVVILSFVSTLSFTGCSVDPRGEGKGVDLYDEVILVKEVLWRAKIGDFKGVFNSIKTYCEGEERRMERRLWNLYMAGDDEGVIILANKFLGKYTASQENFDVLLIKAAAHQRLDQYDEAIVSYESSIPFIEKLNNVQQRKYSGVFFTLAYLYGDQDKIETALSHVKYGLLLEPQNFNFQIYLGELYKRSSQTDVALAHYKDLLSSSQAVEEERAVLKTKIRQINPLAFTEDFKPIKVASMPYYKDFSIKILPMNHHDSVVRLDDICTLLESKFLFACEVLPPVELEENKIIDSERDQYDADKVLRELAGIYPLSRDRRYLLIAITGKDIFSENSNFVFSWQNMNWGTGVVSSYRFITRLDEFYEREIVATRRLGIQFISTTTFLLGFTRSTKPHCPDAYPDGLSDFLQKGSRLCASTIEQRRQLLEDLRKFGLTPTHFDSHKIDEINRVYKKYYFEFEST